MERYKIVWLNENEFIVEFLVDGVSQWESSLTDLRNPAEIEDLVSFINQTLSKED